MREVLVREGLSLLIHKHGGKLYATATACSHYGAQLRRGVSSAGIRGNSPCVSCPLHDATFDLATGFPVRGPALDGIATYKVIVDSQGAAFAELPAGLANSGKHPQSQRPMCRRDPKDLRVFAIVGGGAAALSAAETLRAEGFTGRLVMLTREPHLPYDRVRLSKNQLDQPVDKLLLRPAEFFDSCDIEVLRESLVTKVDAKARVLQYRSNDVDHDLAYDKVLVATGGSPRKLHCPGSKLENIRTLRSPEDAQAIARLARKGQKFVVVGGSFIGMELASTLHKRGCEVSVVAMETVPFERVLGKKVGASFARLLQKQGVRWIGSAQVRLFRGADKVNGVELEDGEVLPADAVVVGAGVLPNTRLPSQRIVEGVSFDKNGAIVVSPLLCSEAEPSLFAAGDVCAFPALQTGSLCRIEHWDVAVQQGRVAARNMLDRFEPFTTVPFFWSGLFDRNLRVAGHAPEILDRVIIEGDVSAMEFIAYYTEDNEIRAVATVNRDPVAVACAELMRRGAMPKVSELMLNTVNADVIMERLRHFSA